MSDWNENSVATWSTVHASYFLAKHSCILSTFPIFHACYFLTKNMSILPICSETYECEFKGGKPIDLAEKMSRQPNSQAVA